MAPAHARRVLGELVSRRDEQWHHCQCCDRGEHARRSLNPEPREQDEPGSQTAADCAECVRQIEITSTPADDALGALGDRVGERKTESHQHCR